MRRGPKKQLILYSWFMILKWRKQKGNQQISNEIFTKKKKKNNLLIENRQNSSLLIVFLKKINNCQGHLQQSKLQTRYQLSFNLKLFLFKPLIYNSEDQIHTSQLRQKINPLQLKPRIELVLCKG